MNLCMHSAFASQPNSELLWNRAQHIALGVAGTTSKVTATQLVHSLADSDETSQFQRYPGDEIVVKVQNVLKNHRNSSEEEIEKALDQCELELSDDLVVDVVNRNPSDWQPAYMFFKYVRREGGYSPGSDVYNEILDALGRARRFEELIQVFDEMSERKGLVNERTYGILLNRYAAAHKVEESIEVFNRRNEFGLRDDSVAFQGLLMWLCRYKHVEDAETLFQSKKNEFGFDIKAWNIILNGWCVLGNVHEAKRFWKDIIASNCKPDSVTGGTFINALTKKGKLGTAMKLFRAMWEKGCNPDTVTCNCVIDALCFKKRIPEALEVFREMSKRGCLPNVTTYNTLIKHLCKIQRMEKVYELLDEMDLMKGNCLPNDRTYVFLLKSLRKPEEVPKVLERMEQNGCKMNGDIYNLMLKMYMKWGCEERVRYTWDDMEKNGMGPDQRSYTIMIHGLYEKGRLENALSYFNEMRSKGMVMEPPTEILVNTLNIKLKEKEENRAKWESQKRMSR
ncbi:hypothetical protein JRO89_XS15G0104600 [Xanthoceras sorbifolium]|uniref:Pentatricopeptide repeat-containing protein n=1 Tax=Xanthoceras sorbifolium TaxID=99658 RepID=A0ABQ8H1P2_9ROSI|nr:hypothetical protein JRO89_XS15G0104600 [Xanthoceras sorbifolium]